jgi:uncharacterized protein (TIGR00255 family)
MICSMTGFARAESQTEWGRLSWELRSVNHRYLEVSMRVPEELRQLDAAVREAVAARLGRGKVECNLRFSAIGGITGGMELNAERASALLALCQQAEQMIGPVAPISAMELLRWPGVVEEKGIDVEPVAGAAMTLLDSALEQLRAARQREGERLQALIEQRCGALQQQVSLVREHLPEIRTGLRNRLYQRLGELEVEVDNNRLEQELAMQLQKTDVDEEVDRLSGHIEEVRAVLQRDEPVGRRLDFLMQELNREANTLGSKSVSPVTTQVSVEMKVLIEQMREQVQNIE